MKLLRFEYQGVPRLGALKGDGIVDLSPLSRDFPSMMVVVQNGAEALDRIGTYHSGRHPDFALSAVPLLCPIERPGKYLAIGMNYRKHVAEAQKLGISAPQSQLWFNKQTSCLAGPHDPIDPGVTRKLDYEVELGVVIGKPAKQVAEADAPDHVFGYFVANDVSARDWQFHSPTFTVGKSFDTHGPIGPWIVTRDEIEDPHDLGLRCYVNGELRQSSHTGQMIFNVWQQISYLSTAFTLESGDLLATGTPEGVGIGMSPPQFLQAGDVVRCEVDRLGAIENITAAAPPHA